ncbi:phage tail protein [Yersinia enterocolitica]
MQKIGDIPNTRADSNGEFTDGNVAGGVPPTILPAAWFNTIQRELMSVLSAAEIDADSAQFNQVLLSIQKLIGEGIPDIKDASLTQKGIVQLSNATNSTSEVLAATPKAVRAVDIAALKIANNLSEIKDAGPTAVAQTLVNLGFGDRLLEANGYFELPGGLLLQWGHGSVNAYNTTVRFKKPFNVTPFIVLPHKITAEHRYVTSVNYTLTGFSLYGWNGDGMANNVDGYTYLALGI